MPRKVRDLIRDLLKAGFLEIPGGGKGSHRKFAHVRYAGAVAVSGRSGDDVHHYTTRKSK